MGTSNSIVAMARSLPKIFSGVVKEGAKKRLRLTVPDRRTPPQTPGGGSEHPPEAGSAYPGRWDRNYFPFGQGSFALSFQWHAPRWTVPRTWMSSKPSGWSSRAVSEGDGEPGAPRSDPRDSSRGSARLRAPQPAAGEIL